MQSNPDPRLDVLAGTRTRAGLSSLGSVAILQPPRLRGKTKTRPLCSRCRVCPSYLLSVPLQRTKASTPPLRESRAMVVIVDAIEQKRITVVSSASSSAAAPCCGVGTLCGRCGGVTGVATGRDSRPRARAPVPSRSADRLEHLRRVAGRLDLLEHPRDAPLLVDEEGGARDAPVLPPVHRLLLPHAVGLGDAVVRIGEQPEIQAVLVAELPVRLD